MIEFPGIKKTVKKFILNEDGKISKHNLLKLGILVTGLAAAAIKENAAGASCTCNAHASLTGHNSADTKVITPKDSPVILHSNDVGHINWVHADCTAMHDNISGSGAPAFPLHASGYQGGGIIGTFGSYKTINPSHQLHTNNLNIVFSENKGLIATGTHTHAVSHNSNSCRQFSADQVVWGGIPPRWAHMNFCDNPLQICSDDPIL
jgi:hypothetical protein